MRSEVQTYVPGVIAGYILVRTGRRDHCCYANIWLDGRLICIYYTYRLDVYETQE